MKQTNNKFPISDNLKSLSEQQVAGLDQEVSDGKAWELYCNGHVSQPMVFENQLSGIVMEDFNHYLVEVKVNGNQITTTCNCGIRGQVCKHAVALLHSWVNDGDGFEDVGNSLRLLENKNKAELIDIIGRMIIKNPKNIDYCADEDTIMDYGSEMEDIFN